MGVTTTSKGYSQGCYNGDECEIIGFPAAVALHGWNIADTA